MKGAGETKDWESQNTALNIWINVSGIDAERVKKHLEDRLGNQLDVEMRSVSKFSALGTEKMRGSLTE